MSFKMSTWYKYNSVTYGHLWRSHWCQWIGIKYTVTWSLSLMNWTCWLIIYTGNIWRSLIWFWRNLKCFLSIIFISEMAFFFPMVISSEFRMSKERTNIGKTLPTLVSIIVWKKHSWCIWMNRELKPIWTSFRTLINMYVSTVRCWIHNI